MKIFGIKEHQYNNDMFDKLNDMMGRVNLLEDLYETAKAKDDSWSMNVALLELNDLNKQLDQLKMNLASLKHFC